MNYASSLLGTRVRDREGTSLGRVSDIAVLPSGDTAPPVVGIVVRRKRRDWRIPVEDLLQPPTDGIRVCTSGARLRPYDRSPGEMLIFGDFVDREVIDRTGVRVCRVNDAVLEQQDGVLRLAGVDASIAGVLRRLLPGTLGTFLKGACLAWEDMELLGTGVLEPGRLSHRRLRDLHPSDIGRLIDHLPFRFGLEILSALEDGPAADALEEAERVKQRDIFETMPPDQAARLLNRMAPDAAADLLQDMPRARADQLIGSLEPEAASNIRLLLSYPHNSAGGLMTTDFVIAPEGETTSEALVYVRRQIRKPDLIYYIYVVDNPDQRSLRGVISLRDLLLAEPDTPLKCCMKATIRAVGPAEHCKEVARIMGEYNLLALPVVDEAQRMLGLVTADDVLDLMLPDNLRRHLPRLFS